MEEHGVVRANKGHLHAVPLLSRCLLLAPLSVTHFFFAWQEHLHASSPLLRLSLALLNHVTRNLALYHLLNAALATSARDAMFCQVITAGFACSLAEPWHIPPFLVLRPQYALLPRVMHP